MPGRTAEEGGPTLALNWEQPRLVSFYEEHVAAYWGRPLADRMFPSWRGRDLGWHRDGWRGRSGWRLRPISTGFPGYGGRQRYQHLLPNHHEVTREADRRGYYMVGSSRFPVNGGPEIISGLYQPREY